MSVRVDHSCIGTGIFRTDCKYELVLKRCYLRSYSSRSRLSPELNRKLETNTTLPHSDDTLAPSNTTNEH